MAEGKIIRLGGTTPVIIDGQTVVSGEYGGTIAKFDTVFANLIPEVLAGPR
jgi:hypothetical protein